MRVAVLMGGVSEERDVSLATGVQVAGALRRAGHDVVAVDSARGILETSEERAIADSGVGRLPPDHVPVDRIVSGTLTTLVEKPAPNAVDVVFVALHGGAGEDGTVQALLDLAGIAYTGSGRLGCALAMDKDVSKRLLRDAGIATPEWMTGAPTADEIAERLGLPVIVKAASGGSSLRLIVAHDQAELEAAIGQAASFDDLVLYERFVTGREFTVGIVGSEALPVGEIIPEHEIFDYECKYQPGMAREIFPADIPHGLATELREVALRVHDVLRMDDYSRVDFVVDGEGKAWCLEANALPGMTSNSLLPKAAAAAKIPFPELCDRIVSLALARARRDR